ncbi:hypothetical protein B0X71_17195 [Planococcus lenghuensis]|uniref:SHOCT domain-containing protein n=1 Tax=Planococcus lenghuensis TaxID=2213202 RepID=A0A1Q2L2H9_9BACL|nr:hypothetical protein B0X71_17195 [Planococcus lenghuensis]
MNTIIWIIVIGLFVYGLVALLTRRDPGKSAPEKRQDTSMEILRERFARGEIDEEEYERRKEFLQNRRNG